VTFGGATKADLDEAAALAAAAFGPYRATSPEQRAVFLETVAAKIEAIGDDLIVRAMAETGLPRARLEGERGRTMGQLKMFAGVLRDGGWLEARIDPAQPDRKPMARPDLRLRNVPLGPVAVFGASNFPLAFSVAGGDTASALAAGCPVVVKAHPAHPGTSELVGRAVQAAVKECGLPSAASSPCCTTAASRSRKAWSPTPASRPPASPARAAPAWPCWPSPRAVPSRSRSMPR
jgi:alpha-ketoglutaric semialdehyde dehydrogenase